MSEHFRRSARAAIELRVCFRRDEPGSALEKAGLIADLGMGGAFVQSERPPAIGTPIVLTLQAPTAWDPLELPAEVRWVSGEGEAAAPAGLGRGFGLKFRSLAPTQAAALYELLSSAGFAEEREG
jgi:Tfp pilus assembly protein PilZ